MGFETPAYLWGATAALIPLLLHLINRRRATVHAFAAVEFILLSNKRIARRLKLKQWLLLAMRMLLIAVLPLAFAKPYLTSEETALPATATPASVVLVLDCSFSMSYGVGGESLLENALDKARAIVADLRPESDAAVVLASSPARALNPRLTYDRQELIAAIASVEPTHGRADIQGALRLAEQILVASGQPQRQVVLLTDLQATEWEGITRPWSLEHSPRVSLVDMRPSGDHSNGAVTDIVAEPETSGLGRDVRVTVEILNDRPKAFEDVVTVRVGDRTAKGIVKVPPRQKQSKEFTIRLAEVGSVSGTVEIPKDDLPGDNVAPFVIDLVRRVQVLVVNGSPRTVPHRDETFFLRAALQPGRDSGSRMNPTFVKADELTPAQLEYVDVVVLANVAELDMTQVNALSGWVTKGGGLLVTSGDNVTVETYNTVMRKLLPLPIRDIKDAGEHASFLTGVETSHPVLAVFAHLPDASLFATRTDRYVLLDTAAARDTAVLASYTGGAPALVERKVGAGHIIMLTTTIDRDWTDLPFKTSFLPLTQQLILHLAGKLEREEQPALVVGEPYTIRVERDTTRVVVTRPDGREQEFSGADLAAETLRYHNTSIGGIYTVRQLADVEGSTTQRRREEARFAVRVDPRESVLQGADRDSLEVILGGGAEDPGGGGKRHGDVAPPPARRGEIWPMMLIGLFVLLGFETWLAYRFGN